MYYGKKSWANFEIIMKFYSRVIIIKLCKELPTMRKGFYFQTTHIHMKPEKKFAENLYPCYVWHSLFVILFYFIKNI